MKLLLFFLLPLIASGHDLQVTWQKEGRAVIIRSAYAGTEVCAYAGIEIFSPNDSRVEFQNGRTDARGMFSFVPDRVGKWRAVIDDEMGHRVETIIDLTDLSNQAESGSVQPIWQKTITGLVLIIGLTGFLYGWKARRTS